MANQVVVVEATGLEMDSERQGKASAENELTKRMRKAGLNQISDVEYQEVSKHSRTLLRWQFKATVKAV